MAGRRQGLRGSRTADSRAAVVATIGSTEPCVHRAITAIAFPSEFLVAVLLVAKYGFEAEHLASARDLFGTADAALAVEHADEGWRAANTLANLAEDRLVLVTSAESI